MLGAATHGYAQNEAYQGGEGGGGSHTLTAVLTCTNNRFSGGEGSGVQYASSSQLSCSPFRFSGDSAAGVAWASAAIIACSPFRFAGDSAAGMAAAVTQLISCNLFRFAGDTGSGYQQGLFIRPRDFLGNDTAITIICSEERYNLLQLYRFEGITLAWSTPTPDTVFTGNFRVIGSTTGGCLDTAFALIQQEIGVWNGSVSNDWHTAANWNNNQVPGSKTHVIIPANTPNPCVISQADAEAVSVQGKLNGNFRILNNRNLLISGRCAQVPPGP